MTTSGNKTAVRWGLAAALVLAAMLVAAYRIADSWEPHLLGPYMGEKYGGRLTGAPSSTIAVKDKSAELYKTLDSRGPVLALRGRDGAVMWSYVLVPSDVVDGETNTWRINDIRFRRVKRTGSGSKLYVSCDWDHGGVEMGVVYLDANLSFKGISISW